jgi:hypothetical protein
MQSGARPDPGRAAIDLQSPAMTIRAKTLACACAALLAAGTPATAAEPPPAARPRPGRPLLHEHPIALDAQGKIVPWLSRDLGRAYDGVVRLVWAFWHDMRRDYNGLPYYMNHQVWQPDVNDRRGIGGDQLAMALSSWTLLYAYMGRAQGFHHNDPVRENMAFLADYYLSHSLSPSGAAWPRIPYPYNTATYSGIYDGDMVLGRGYTQPDKAGSFGRQLLDVYKVTRWRVVENRHYLDAAIAIADTLAAKVQPGDADRSPLPFKVHAETGEVGRLIERGKTLESSYTTNWAPTLELFAELVRMKQGKVELYQRAFDTILAWMKKHPLRTQKWGPFFEDIHGWSDTQVNAVTFAEYILEHRELFPTWRQDVQAIFDWVYRELGNREWEKYGVVAVNEQTAYRVPGNSHTARQAAAELRFVELTGDAARKENAIRQLSWATYTVDREGRNRYPRDEIWLTDGYGDYVRHYLRAMAAAPELAPAHEDHLLRATGVVNDVVYEPQRIVYRTFEAPSREVLRLTAKPTAVKAGGKAGGNDGRLLPEVTTLDAAEGWTWTPIDRAGGKAGDKAGGKAGGVLRVRHDREPQITIEKPRR